MRIVGIDPGMTGAIALLDGEDLIAAHDMPVAGGHIAIPVLAHQITDFAPDLIVIEQVNSMPKQGVASTFKFGVAYGIAQGVASAWRTELVRPTAWKKTHRLNGKDKDASRALAIRLWPDQADLFATKAKGQARADAALLALHLARTLTTETRP